MNIKNIEKAIPILLKYNAVPFFWGRQGVGKTEFWHRYTKANDLQLVCLNTATQEPGDLIGLLVKNDTTGTAYHTRPEWFPTEGKGIIFLDELNRAPNEVHQALFPFVQKGVLHTHNLPPGWRVVAAGNYNSENFTVTDTSDAAWNSRFCHMDFQPTVEEWIMYAENKGLLNIASFVREQPSMLGLTTKEKLDMSFITPNPRNMELVGKLEEDDDIPDDVRYEIYTGLLGVAAAAAVTSYRNKKDKALSLIDILGRYSKVKSKIKTITSDPNTTRLDLLNQPIDELMTKLEANPSYLTADSYLANLQQFLLDIPRELAMKAFSKFHTIHSFHGKNTLLNDIEYVKKFKR